METSYCERDLRYNPLKVLKKGHDDKTITLPDLLTLEEILQKGEQKFELVLTEDQKSRILPLISQALVTRIDNLFGKKEPVFSKMVGTIILNRYGNFAAAAKRGNEASVRYFLPTVRQLPPEKFGKAVRQCIKHQLSVARRVFEALVEGTSFPSDSSRSFDHFLGHAALKHRWVRIYLFSIEKKLNMLRVFAKVQLTVDRGGIIRGTHSKTDVDFTELHEAVSDQDVKKTEELVKRGDDINGTDHEEKPIDPCGPRTLT